MKILPPQTRLPKRRTERRHTPTGGYRKYRACLRWDFGFTCAFCLLHETDFEPSGVEGLGLFWIEHHITQSSDSSQRDRYENCYYSCRLCNTARSSRSHAGPNGEALLRSDVVAWSDHFRWEGDKLLPLQGDRDAAYTDRCYDLNDERKQTRRRSRREEMEEAWRVLEAAPERSKRLADLLERSWPDAIRQDLLEASEVLHRAVLQAQASLRRHRAIPVDCGEQCVCSSGSRVLPVVWERQTSEV